MILPPDTNYLSGHWNLICTDTNGCQNYANTVTITIKTNPNLPMITQNAPLCIGDDLDLDMALVSGATYQWYAPDSTLIDTTFSTTITGLVSDTAFYGVVTVNGCSAYDSVHVHVHPVAVAPNVGAVADTICENDLLQLQTSTNAIGYD